MLQEADTHFAALGLDRLQSDARARHFRGVLGTLTISVKMEGGHYTFVEAHTDQVGESRLDKNVKKYFVRLHRRADPRHQLEAAY